ncbi:MAG: ThiF family adenylyltransferase [Planctomycetes bacterium]|nr:ThiF family adenylyltransferase [Planctomycetota bacterium]
MNRYDRQQKTSGGADLDERWSQLRILLVGCGGVGTPLAQALVRGGIGKLTILDGDRVRETDLHRQTLFLEEHARQSVAKATAALATLQQIGGRTTIEAVADMLTPSNAEHLFLNHDIVLDATDNIAARLLIDRTALTTGVGWIHSGAIADRWVAASFLPPGSPCYHCWVPVTPEPGSIGTCESEGVLPVACLAAASCVLRLLTSWLRDGGDSDRLEATRKIIRGSVDEGETIVHLQADPRCPHCSEVLEAGSRGGEANSVHLRKLCGAGSIETWLDLDLDEVENRLRQFDTTLQIERGSVSVRAKDEHGALICYRNGRALLTGNHAQHLETARELLEGWLGDDALVRL